MFMSNKTIVHALIPARGGSKSIPRKNIKRYKEYPLLVHSILSATEVPFIKRIVVSTDCPEIKRIAIENGAEAPFLRPKDISGDFSTDIECFQHYLSWLRFMDQEVPDVIVHLRPTYPERDSTILQKCLSAFLLVKEKYSCLRTVVPIDKSLFKMYTINEKETSLKPTYTNFNDIKEPYNQVRQILPTTYLHNGCIDIVNRKTIDNGSMSGDKMYAYVMPKEETYDIDTEEDWERSLKQDDDIERIYKNLGSLGIRSKPIDIPPRNTNGKNNSKEHYFYTY